MSLCSPSGRASSANSTWGANHSCLPVGWISSGSNGGDPSVTSLSKRRTLQATATPHFSPYLNLGQTSNRLPFDLLLPDPVVADSPEGGNGTGPECCPMASEVFMTGRQQCCESSNVHRHSGASETQSFCLSDLGWDNWVVHPLSLTIITCVPCDPQGTVVQCPSSHSSPQDADSQV